MCACMLVFCVHVSTCMCVIYVVVCDSVYMYVNVCLYMDVNACICTNMSFACVYI